jgi:hypothetical protein
MVQVDYRLASEVKSRSVVISVVGVYEVWSEVSSYVIRIMARTIIILTITTG